MSPTDLRPVSPDVTIIRSRVGRILGALMLSFIVGYMTGVTFDLEKERCDRAFKAGQFVGAEAVLKSL